MSTVFHWMARSFAPRRPWQAYDLILCLELSQLRRSVGLGCEVAFKCQPLLGSEGAKDVGAVPFREVDIPPFFQCDSQRSYRVVQPGFHRARRYLLLAGDVANGLAEVVGADNGARCSGRRSYRAASSMTTPYLGPTASLGLSAAPSDSGHEFALGRGGTTVHPSKSAVVSRTSW